MSVGPDNKPGYYEALLQMELRLIREIQDVRDEVSRLRVDILSEPAVRAFARDEITIMHRQIWSKRSAIAAVALFMLSISSFVLTAAGLGPFQ